MPLGTDLLIRAYAINATDTVYGNLVYTYHNIAMKPNIYIYPTEKMQLSVNLSFPQGGNIITSIPDYNTGWDVTVEPDGKIDDEYTYLFYESYQPSVWQTKAGCVITSYSIHYTKLYEHLWYKPI